MALPRTLKNFALFFNAVSYVGEVPKIKLPKLARKMEDYRAGGMNIPVKLDFGMEPLTLEWTAGGFLPSVMLDFGAGTHNATMLRFAAALQSEDASGYEGLEVFAMGRHSEIDFGEAEAGKPTEHSYKTELSYYRLTDNGTPIIEIDAVNMIERIGDVDRMEEIRALLGL
ncbi:phage major tail tube protein [Azohydromonas lata]|uniref:Phage major tail tube protein n=1 Tax=Azohydromonas lata TaxID=45677 RepID=A0ABU5ICZ8_9BURK|nr:phage major tail tube protein [Azohydromonas lata]MDZ5456991.1 phage major tail tube protein [Azohydromonas lata]